MEVAELNVMSVRKERRKMLKVIVHKV